MAAPEERPASRPRSPESPLEPSIVVVIDGPIARVDVPALCDRVRVLLESSGAGPVLCDVGALVEPDAATVEALARLQLTVRRLGRRMGLRNARGELRGLLALMGLSDVLPCCPDSGP